MASKKGNQTKKKKDKQSKQENKKAFAQSTGKLEDFMHHFNAVIIENALADGTIKEIDVVRELLNIQSGTNFELMKTQNVPGVGVVLVEVFSKVSEGCAAAGKPCEGLDVLRNGVIAMESMAREISVKYGEHFTPDSPLAHLAWLSGVPAEVENYKKRLNDVLDAFEKSKDYGKLTSPELLVELNKMAVFKGMHKNPILFFDQAASVHKAGSLKQEKLESEMNKVLTLKAASLDLKSNKSLEESKEKLKSINTLVDHFASLLSDDSLNPIIKEMHYVVLANNFGFLNIKDRNFTHGFFNGGQDFVEYFDNLDSGSSEKNVLLNSPKESVKNYLVHSSELSKKIKPSLEVFQTGKSLSLAEENIKEVLIEAKTEIWEIVKVQESSGCYLENQEFDVPNGFDTWENEKNHTQILGNNGAGLVEKLSNIPKGLPLFEKFAEGFDEGSMSPRAVLQKMDSYPEKDQIVQELKTRASELESLTPELQAVQSYVNGTKIMNLFPSTATWFENSGASRILNCLQNKTMTVSLMNAFGNRSKFSLSEMKPDNKYILDFKEAQTTLGKQADEWNKIKKVFEKRKKNKRSAKNRPKLDDPFGVNRDLSYAVKLFYDLVTADNIGDFLENIMKSEGPIENMLNNLPDRVLRDRLKKLFTPEIRKSLKSLPSVIAQNDKKIVKVPNDKDEFSNFFKNVKMEGLSNVKIGELTDILVLAGLPLDRNVPEEIKYMELEFSNGSTKLANGLKAFLLAHAYLSAVLSPEDMAAIDLQIGSGYEFQWWHAVLGAGAAVFIAFLIRFIYFYVKNEGEVKQRFAKAKADTFTWNQKKKEKEEEKKAETKEEKGEGEKKAKKIKVVEFKSGEIGVCPESNTSAGRDSKNRKPVVNPAFDEDGPKKSTKPEKPKPLKAHEIIAKHEKALEKLKKYAEHQNDIHSKTEADAEKILTFKFHKNTMEELEVADRLEIKDLELSELKNAPMNVCLQAKIEYLCGSGYDLYEEDDERGSSDTKHIQEELDKTQAELTEISKKTAKFVDDLSKKVLKTSTSRGRQNEVSIDTTQDSNLDDQTRASAGADPIDGTISRRWNHPPDEVMRILRKNLKDGYEEDPEPNPNDYMSECFEGQIIRNEDNTFNTRMMRVYMSRKKVIELAPMKKLDEPERRKPLISMNDARDLIRLATEKVKDAPAFLKLNRRKTRLVGDIHGYYADFLREINLGELDDTTYIMTGDLVGRGVRSIDTLLYMITLMLSNPKKYNYIRGNHELAHTNIEDGFFDECVNTYGEIDGREFWTLANGFFAELPVACLLNNKTFVAHGGISHLMRQGRDVFQKIKKRPVTGEEWKLWIDLLWSDPDQHYTLSTEFEKLFPVSKRSRDANKFSPVALISILEACEIEGVIRAHEIPQNGYQTFCFSKCITTYGAPNMHRNNRAAQTIVYSDNTIIFIRFRNQNESNAKDNLTCGRGLDKEHKNSKGTGGKKKRSRSKSPSTLVKMEEGKLGKRCQQA
ncbi:unnamed protein product [Caenorhabditis nigoni]